MDTGERRTIFRMLLLRIRQSTHCNLWHLVPKLALILFRLLLLLLLFLQLLCPLFLFDSLQPLCLCLSSLPDLSDYLRASPFPVLHHPVRYCRDASAEKDSEANENAYSDSFCYSSILIFVLIFIAHCSRCVNSLLLHKSLPEASLAQK